MSRRFIEAVLLAAAVSVNSPIEAASLRWFESLEEASAVARTVNKPMLLDFWASWCASCKTMDDDVFSSDVVVKKASSILPVRIDIDRRGQVARAYRVYGVPTLVLTDSYGNELFRVAGALSRTAMEQLLGEFPQDITEINRWSRILAEDRNNTEAMKAMGRALKVASLYRASNEYFARAVRSTKSGTPAGAEVYAAMGWNSLALKDATDAIRMFERALSVPQHPTAAESMLGLAQAMWLKGDRAKAKRVLEQLIVQAPTGSTTDAAREFLAAWSGAG